MTSSLRDFKSSNTTPQRTAATGPLPAPVPGHSALAYNSLDSKTDSKNDTVINLPIASVSASSQISFFSLKTSTMKALLANEHKFGKEYVNSQLQLSPQLREEYVQFKQEQLKTILTAIGAGVEPEKVKKLIEEYPILLLEELDEKDYVKTLAGQKTTKKTPYKMALAEDDTQMASMIKTQLIKFGFTKQAEDQYNEQLPKGWEVEEEKKWQPIFKQLDELTQFIRYAAPADIISSGHPDYKLTIRPNSCLAVELAKFHSL